MAERGVNIGIFDIPCPDHIPVLLGKTKHDTAGLRVAYQGVLVADLFARLEAAVSD